MPDGSSHIFRLYVFGPSGFWTMSLLRYAGKYDPFLSLDCLAPTPFALAQSKERKGSNFAAQHSGAIVQKSEGPNTYNLNIWLSPSGNYGAADWRGQNEQFRNFQSKTTRPQKGETFSQSPQKLPNWTNNTLVRFWGRADL